MSVSYFKFIKCYFPFLLQTVGSKNFCIIKQVFATCCFLFIVEPECINAQYPLAPEVWSIPEKVAVISEWATRSQSPSISFDKQKLYFEGLAVTEWGDTSWTEPYSLPSHINQHLARYPAISPNGKRLFFTWFFPSWDLYYSDWDSVANDWGPAINCGPNINSPAYAEGGCVLPNDTTLIFLRSTTSHISYWDKQTQTWGPAESWPTPTLLFASDLGIYVSPSYKKVYYEGSRIDTTINGEFYLNYDIIVRYADSTNPSGYTIPYILNFCLYADTQYFAGNYVDRLEGFPTLTPDGKKMYFTATYHGQTTIYESIMLIDENGNPVNVDDDYEYGIIPEEIELYP
ncbi:MAG: hypothetical protein V3V72_12900, partial [Ignavibacteriaceae bacterium]